MAAAGSSGARALRLYRRILRTARTWEAESERDYIRKEAGALFRKNRVLQTREEIEEKLFEGEARLELGLHYRIPYPRPSYVASGATGKSRETPRPAYMSSYEEINDRVASGKKTPKYGDDAHLQSILPRSRGQSSS